MDTGSKPRVGCTSRAGLSGCPQDKGQSWRIVASSRGRPGERLRLATPPKEDDSEREESIGCWLLRDLLLVTGTCSAQLVSTSYLDHCYGDPLKFIAVSSPISIYIFLI
ncbi:hypothetical protein RRG08_014724 [Elysia crispata]|uniref:Uncharacterized protein n=1 Tax=Elysia crispata TaxID=231223 RepID=A0AAE1E3U9_9GAST|nr:hypothetical protein RRG08_014724 [Elysia crispata]